MVYTLLVIMLYRKFIVVSWPSFNFDTYVFGQLSFDILPTATLIKF